MSPPIKTLGGIIPIAPIGNMVDSVIKMIDEVVKAASMPIPEDKLN